MSDSDTWAYVMLIVGGVGFLLTIPLMVIVRRGYIRNVRTHFSAFLTGRGWEPIPSLPESSLKVVGEAFMNGVTERPHYYTCVHRYQVGPMVMHTGYAAEFSSGVSGASYTLVITCEHLRTRVPCILSESLPPDILRQCTTLNLEVPGRSRPLYVRFERSPDPSDRDIRATLEHVRRLFGSNHRIHCHTMILIGRSGMILRGPAVSPATKRGLSVAPIIESAEELLQHAMDNRLAKMH